MKVVWSAESLNDLDAIYAYIAKDSPIYARRIIERLLNRGDQVAMYPKSGRKVLEMNRADIREIIEGSYRIMYHLTPETIEILTILHGAKLFPELLI